MYYMKRTGKKNTTPEISGTKAPKQASAQTSKQEKLAVSRKKANAAPEKIVKKLKVEPAAKMSAPAPKAKKTVSAKNLEKTVIQKIKPIAKKTPEKSSPKVPVKATISAPKTKKASENAKVPATQKKSVAAEKIVQKTKPVVSKTNVEKPPATKTVSKPKKEKIVQPAAAKKSKPAKVKASPESAPKKIKPAAKKVEIIVPAINQKREKKTKTTAGKVEIVVPPVKSKAGKKAETVAKKTSKKPERKIEKKVEIVIPPMVAKPFKKKPSKPIGSAVVRGKSGRYDFEVFPLDADLKDGSAIYVISKRITDKRGRGHHKFVCIGQTESLLGEIKKHRKDKCITQHKANVICLLREESEGARLKIESDLREAHTIACNQK